MKEIARHYFWYCPTIKEWWHQLQHIIFQSLGFRIKTFQITLGINWMASQEHAWLFSHIRFWMLYLIRTTKKIALFNQQVLFTAVLPWKLMKNKLTEDAVSIVGAPFKKKLLTLLTAI